MAEHQPLLSRGEIINFAARYAMFDSDDAEAIFEPFARAIEEAVLARVAPTWQPIETAPKFETILIWQPEYKRVTLSINDGFEWKHATHWMPLPAPPSHQEGAKLQR
jgi:hypothetical protein